MYLKHFLIYMIQTTYKTSVLFALCTPKGEICAAFFFKMLNIKNNIKIRKGRKDYHLGIIAVCFPYKTTLCEDKIYSRMRK